MRATFTTLLLAVLAAVSVSAGAKTSAATSADPTATPVATATAAADNAAAPIYPGAVPGVRPEGVGFNTPPPQVKTYSTSDDFATVRAWYRAHLKGASEVVQPGMDKTEDAFLVGKGASAVAVLIQTFKGRTWILIGPPQ
jgi:hypothetical protein